jgi:NAD+ synthase (glutamine-hydrolysing)
MEEIIEAGFDEETVDRVLQLVRFAEFKRRQAAPGIKLTPRSFGTGWRMPLACKREL